MTEYSEKHYSIDPGLGKKMDGCPYSTFEDGQDVKDYIIPPKGYVFTCFRFDPLAKNQIYDGKLIAEYAKEPIHVTLKSNLWKVILPIVIIGVIALITLLTISVFNSPKTNLPKEPQSETKISPTDNNITNPSPSSRMETPNTTLPAPQKEIEKDHNDNVANNTPTPESAIQSVDDPNVKFKEEFWALIHQRTIMMDPYDALFKEYKNKVEGEEYDYLRFTILKDYNSFKEWYEKLRKVPVAELEGINTTNDLKKKLKNIE